MKRILDLFIGLGFFHAKSSIMKLGGSIDISSELEIGTTVELEIPLYTDTKPLSEAGADLIHIDNDKLALLLWKAEAKKQGFKIASFEDPEEALLEAENLAKDTPIFIDSDFGHGNTRGEVFAEEFYKKGFENIYISTGAPSKSLEELNFIKKILGKEFPKSIIENL